MKKVYLAAAMAMAAFTPGMFAADGVTVDPADNSVNEMLSSFRLTFEGYTKVMPSDAMMAFSTEGGPVELINEAGETVRYGGALPSPLMNNTADVLLAREVCTAEYLSKRSDGTANSDLVIPSGIYTLSIPAGAFTLTADDGSTTTSPELKFTYDLHSYEVSKSVMTVSAPKGEVSEVSEITISFNPVPGEISINSAVKDKIAVIDLGGLPIARANFSDIQINEGVVTAKISKPFNTPGVYYIEVPEGFFLLDGATSPYYASGRFTIKQQQSDEKTFSADPAIGSTVKYIFEISLLFNGYSSLEYANEYADYDTSKAYFLKDGAPESDKIVASLGYNFNQSCWALLVTPELMPEEDGVYRLFIPEDAVKADGQPFVFPDMYWTVGNPSGVESAGMEDARFDIYNLTGTRIAVDADNTVLNALPAGIYIAGGRKVLVK